MSGKKLTRAQIKALAEQRSSGQGSGQFSNPLPAIGQGLKELMVPQHTARQKAAAQGIEAAGAPPQFVPPNEWQKSLDQRNADVGAGFVEGSNSPWHTTPAVGGIELKEAGMQVAPLAQPGQGVTDDQVQAAIGGAGDLSLTQGKVTAPPAPTTLNTSAGQYGRSVSPGDPNKGQPMMGVEWSGPQGEASYDAPEMGQDQPRSGYAQELAGRRPHGQGPDYGSTEYSSTGLDLGAIAGGNKNMREGRSGQGSFGIAAPGAMNAMAGAGGYAGSTPEGQANGGISGIAGGSGNAPSPAVGGGVDNGSGEGLAAQQARIATMRQWQGIDPSERGKMPQNVRDAFGMGPAPKEKIDSPVKTQEWKRELDMRNAGVGADTAHGKNSPWYNPESQAAAAGRQAGVAAKYAAEDVGIDRFNADKMDIQQDEKELEADQEMSRLELEEAKSEGAKNRQTNERLASIRNPEEKFRATPLKQYNEHGEPTGETLSIWDPSTGQVAGGQQGIEGGQPNTEEAFTAHMAAQGVDPNSAVYKDALKEFRIKQGLK